MITFAPKSQFDKKVTILLIEQSQLKKRTINVHLKTLQKSIVSLFQRGQFNAEKGEMFPFVFSHKIILLVGLGKKQEFSSTTLRSTLRKAVASPILKKIKEFDIVPHEEKEDTVCSIIEAVAIGTYQWKKFLPQVKQGYDQKIITIIASRKKIYENILTVVRGVNLARDLVNDNADTVTADFIENKIKAIVKGRKNIHLEILNKKDLQKKKMNLHLAVNQGSPKEPKLVIVKYSGGAKQDYTALIGKGITFDAGGLNLKPTGYIETMRTDMGGAAAVVGVLQNIVSLRIKKNVIFAVGLAENTIGSGAYKPGDVLKSYSGKTVEVANTDAEGRLVLADAISYIAKNYKPKRIIDIATLTGACVVALGHDYTGLMSDNESLSNALLASAQETDDRLWRLPVYEELKEHIKSQVADLKNVGLPKGTAGALSAAEFLRQFTENIAWAHLDIAGTAFVEGEGRLYYNHGATGVGVRLLTNYLMNQ